MSRHGDDLRDLALDVAMDHITRADATVKLTLAMGRPPTDGDRETFRRYLAEAREQVRQIRMSNPGDWL